MYSCLFRFMGEINVSCYSNKQCTSPIYTQTIMLSMFPLIQNYIIGAVNRIGLTPLEWQSDGEN